MSISNVHCRQGLWIEKDGESSCPDAYAEWKQEPCDDDDMDPITTDQIPASHLIRLRVNGKLECYNICTLLEHILNSRLRDRDGVLIVRDPLTNERFSEHQLDRILLMAPEAGISCENYMSSPNGGERGFPVIRLDPRDRREMAPGVPAGLRILPPLRSAFPLEFGEEPVRPPAPRNNDEALRFPVLEPFVLEPRVPLLPIVDERSELSDSSEFSVTFGRHRLIPQEDELSDEDMEDLEVSDLYDTISVRQASNVPVIRVPRDAYYTVVIRQFFGRGIHLFQINKRYPGLETEIIRWQAITEPGAYQVLIYRQPSLIRPILDENGQLIAVQRRPNYGSHERVEIPIRQLMEHVADGHLFGLPVTYNVIFQVA
jgi:hypothetical protein